MLSIAYCAASAISIHAPTRGATMLSIAYCAASAISIHAPTRGATAFRGKSLTKCWNFNPRSHKGSDQREFKIFLIDANFNPRSHKGSDGAIPVIFCPSSAKFQSTLPQGERLSIYITSIIIRRFQSTLPQGERHTVLRI